MHFDGDACFLMERWLWLAGAEGVHTHARGESRAGARGCVGAARVCVCVGGVVACCSGPARGSWRKGEMVADRRLVGARVARCALRWARWRSERGAAKGHGAGRRTRGRRAGARATPRAERGEIRGRTRRARGCCRCARVREGHPRPPLARSAPGKRLRSVSRARRERVLAWLACYSAHLARPFRARATESGRAVRTPWRPRWDLIRPSRSRPTPLGRTAAPRTASPSTRRPST